jgi:hypothetical protein
MARFASVGMMIGVAGFLAGCVYDPVSHAYEPCCAPPPAYAPPVAAPPPAYAPPPQHYAQTTPPPPGTPPHEPFAERFRRANVTNDGRLTLDQARAAGMHMVVNHFADIDTAHKGYVTMEDIRLARQRLQASRPQPPSQ